MNDLINSNIMGIFLCPIHLFLVMTILKNLFELIEIELKKNIYINLNNFYEV